MEKLIKKLDEIFKKYSVSDEEVAEVGDIIAEVAGGEIVVEGQEDDFNTPEMEGDYGEEAEED